MSRKKLRIDEKVKKKRGGEGGREETLRKTKFQVLFKYQPAN